jgi:hypothetical protein
MKIGPNMHRLPNLPPGFSFTQTHPQPVFVQEGAVMMTVFLELTVVDVMLESPGLIEQGAAMLRGFA